MSALALIVAAAASGSGKTTVTTGLLRAFRKRGVIVRPVKIGPDDIDPAFLAAAASAECPNLDSWAMAPTLLDGILGGAAEGADLVLIELAMGLFDGVPGAAGRTGSAADIAARFGIPVVLVVDVTGQAQTAAAVVRGLGSHARDVRLAGVILNRVGSERHRAFVAEAIAPLGIPVFGALPRADRLTFPSRHLGLVQAGEHDDIERRLDDLAEFVERHVDLERLLEAAGQLTVSVVPPFPALPPPGQRIALARDEAFSFMYPHLVAEWRRAGAEIAVFSPLADETPPNRCDACWLPGGYPELHAGRIAAARRFLSGLARFAETRPVHGECGGHMVLGRFLEDASGERHDMAGLLSHGTSFATRRLSLGYREARLLAVGVLGSAGAMVRGHEFHYSTVAEPGSDAPLVELFDGQGRSLGPAGGQRDHVSGSYFHAIAPA